MSASAKEKSSLEAEAPVFYEPKPREVATAQRVALAGAVQVLRAIKECEEADVIAVGVLEAYSKIQEVRDGFISRLKEKHGSVGHVFFDERHILSSAWWAATTLLDGDEFSKCSPLSVAGAKLEGYVQGATIIENLQTANDACTGEGHEYAKKVLERIAQ